MLKWFVQKVAQPLGELITAITIPPQLVITILDTPISDAWIPAVKQLEALIESVSAHANASRNPPDAVRVKAAKDLEGVLEGVRIAVSALRRYPERYNNNCRIASAALRLRRKYERISFLYFNQFVPASRPISRSYKTQFSSRSISPCIAFFKGERLVLQKNFASHTCDVPNSTMKLA